MYTYCTCLIQLRLIHPQLNRNHFCLALLEQSLNSSLFQRLIINDKLPHKGFIFDFYLFIVFKNQSLRCSLTWWSATWCSSMAASLPAMSHPDIWEWQSLQGAWLRQSLRTEFESLDSSPPSSKTRSRSSRMIDSESFGRIEFKVAFTFWDLCMILVRWKEV